MQSNNKILKTTKEKRKITILVNLFTMNLCEIHIFINKK